MSSPAARIPSSGGSARPPTRRTTTLLLDGAHLLEEALAARAAGRVVAVDEGARRTARSAHWRARAGGGGARVLDVTAAVLAAMSPVRQPSGIVAIARRRGQRRWTTRSAGAPQMVLMLEQVQDPGNVGAIIRAADACGATGVVVGAGTADPYRLEGAARLDGQRVPAAGREPASLCPTPSSARGELGLAVFAAVPRDGTSLPSCDLRGPSRSCSAAKAPGVSADLVALADDAAHHSDAAAVESLNVATAAALIAYEAQPRSAAERRRS